MTGRAKSSSEDQSTATAAVVAALPEPMSLRRMVGPGVVAVGIGLAAGEIILWPYLTSIGGLGLLWLAVITLVVQTFINMEIERYTLATGQTVVAGFSRWWKGWGVLLCLGGALERYARRSAGPVARQRLRVESTTKALATTSVSLGRVRSSRDLRCSRCDRLVGECARRADMWEGCRDTVQRLSRRPIPSPRGDPARGCWRAGKTAGPAAGARTQHRRPPACVLGLPAVVDPTPVHLGTIVIASRSTGGEQRSPAERGPRSHPGFNVLTSCPASRRRRAPTPSTWSGSARASRTGCPWRMWVRTVSTGTGPSVTCPMSAYSACSTSTAGRPPSPLTSPGARASAGPARTPRTALSPARRASPPH